MAGLDPGADPALVPAIRQCPGLVRSLLDGFDLMPCLPQAVSALPAGGGGVLAHLGPARPTSSQQRTRAPTNVQVRATLKRNCAHCWPGTQRQGQRRRPTPVTDWLQTVVSCALRNARAMSWLAPRGREGLFLPSSPRLLPRLTPSAAQLVLSIASVSADPLECLRLNQH